MKALTQLTAAELVGLISCGEVSAVEAVTAYLDRIEKLDPQLQSYNEVLAEGAIKQAQAADDQRKAGRMLPPLLGLPVAIKDNMCTTFGHTTCSSKILADFKAPYTATAVAKLISAGAIVIGKTNLDEFAMGSSTENSSTKTTRNPWNTDCVPGGSSGGSAAAVSAGLCGAALGSDTGGSIRQPAAFCGIVGMKPTYGAVSRYGLVAYGSSLDQIGPMTRDVTDAALITAAISGHDPRDSTSVPRPVPDYMADINTPIEGLKIGLPTEFYSDALDPEINAAIMAAVKVYKNAGAEVVDISLPHSRIDSDEAGQLSSYAVGCYYIVAMAEASSNLARYDGVHYGHRTADPVDNIIDLYSRSRAEGFGDEVKRRIMLGTYTLSSGYYDAYYNKALKVRRLIRNDFDSAFEKCDALLCPVTPTTAFKIGENTADPLKMYLADIYTISANLAGLPGISMPAAMSREGMPIGMQLIGPAFSESTLLRAGRMFEVSGGASRLVPEMAK